MYRERLAESLPIVRDRMAAAAEAAGRPPDAVRLVSVTKGHPMSAVRAALAAGLYDLGENRVDELEEKASQVGDDGVRWHMIGHLQRRAAPRVIGVAHLVHALDSPRLAARLSRAAVEADTELDVLAQVNTSGEESKGGFDAANAVDLVHEVAELPKLRIRGLMTMAPLVDDEAILGATFRRLRETSERLRAVTSSVGPELSMGMTNDLEIAIREGSTMVRIGTALFGERTQ